MTKYMHIPVAGITAHIRIVYTAKKFKFPVK